MWCPGERSREVALSEGPAGTIRWEVHPARERPLAAAAAVLVIAALSMLVQSVGGGWWGVAAAEARNNDLSVS